MAKAVGGPEQITLNWSGQAVDIGRIESELTKLRYAAAGEPDGGQAFALRTSLLNMVVLAPNPEAANEASQAIVNLASHHPSRALILVPEPGTGESSIDAQLAAHCHITPGLEQHVCCEEISLMVKGPAARRLHSIVIPLLVPDLPVYVWWTGPLPEDAHVFEEMVSMADRFIVDSARFADQPAGLRRLARLCTEMRECSVGDLNWERLEPWRRLLLQECHGALAEGLGHTRHVKISFAGARDQLISGQALLMLGWLAERLGWNTDAVEPRGPHGFMFPGPPQDVSAEVRPRAYPGVENGTLMSLSVRCSAGRMSSISLSRVEDPLHLVLHVRESHRVFEDHIRMEPWDQSDMLLREMDSPRETDYLAALNRALPLIRTLLPEDCLVNAKCRT